MGVSTMMVKQISVFLENKPGKLKELTMYFVKIILICVHYRLRMRRTLVSFD